jgi:pimeloyl-ACP methyl ester carboxylesterase
MSRLFAHSLHDWRDGTRFAYEVGPAAREVFYRAHDHTGPTLLLVHGYPFSSYDWCSVWDALAREFRLIAPDLLGFGFSDKPLDGEYSVRHHADMLVALVRDLGTTRVHVVAHDLGVSVAQELLARSERGRLGIELASICFLNGGLFAEAYRPRPMQRLLSSPIGRYVGPRVPRFVFDRVIGGLFGPDTGPTRNELATLWSLVNENEGLRVTHLVGRFIFERVTHRDEWVSAMQRTRVPLAFVDGRWDPNSGMHMVARWRQLLPHSPVVVLPDTIGHWPQLEAPDRVAEHVAAFVRAAA